MKLLLSISLFLTLSPCMASTFSLEECLEQAKEYGGENHVEESCFTTVMTHRDTIAVSNQGIEAYALKSLLYFKEGDRIRLISGTNSKLFNIQAIDLNHDQKQVAIINQNSEGERSLLIFNSSRSGNVGPHKVIQTAEIEQAQDIQFTNDGKKVFLLQEGRIVSYGTNMDSRSPRASQNPILLNQFGSVAAPLEEPENSLFTDKYFFNLNTKSGKVHVYRLDNQKNTKPNFVLTPEKHNLRAPASIALSSKGDKLLIEDNEQGTLEFDLKQFD